MKKVLFIFGAMIAGGSAQADYSCTEGNVRSEIRGIYESGTDRESGNAIGQYQMTYQCMNGEYRTIGKELISGRLPIRLASTCTEGRTRTDFVGEYESQDDRESGNAAATYRVTYQCVSGTYRTISKELYSGRPLQHLASTCTEGMTRTDYVGKYSKQEDRESGHASTVFRVTYQCVSGTYVTIDKQYHSGKRP